MLEPYYSHAGITIYHGDCREILPTLPKCDLLLTDPPYGHGTHWQGGTWGAAQMYRDAEVWDAEKIPDELLSLVLSCAAAAIIWGGNYYSLPPSRCWLAWVKNPAMDTMADFELAWTNFDRPAKKFIENRNPDGKRQHPTQKPLDMVGSFMLPPSVRWADVKAASPLRDWPGCSDGHPGTRSRSNLLESILLRSLIDSCNLRNQSRYRR